MLIVMELRNVKQTHSRFTLLANGGSSDEVHEQRGRRDCAGARKSERTDGKKRVIGTRRHTAWFASPSAGKDGG